MRHSKWIWPEVRRPFYRQGDFYLTVLVIALALVITADVLSGLGS